MSPSGHPKGIPPWEQVRDRMQAIFDHDLRELTEAHEMSLARKIQDDEKVNPQLPPDIRVARNYGIRETYAEQQLAPQTEALEAGHKARMEREAAGYGIPFDYDHYAAERAANREEQRRHKESQEEEQEQTKKRPFSRFVPDYDPDRDRDR